MPLETEFRRPPRSQSASVEWAGSGLDGTVCFPPLIKPDRRFSRIRLSQFLARRPRPTRQRGLGRSRTFMALIAQWAVTSPLRLLLTAEQVASLRSPTGFPNQRSGAGSTLLRTPPTSAIAARPPSFAEVVPRV